MKKSVVLLWCLFFTAIGFSQSMNSDIYLVDVHFDKGNFSFSNLKNVTNKKGYDNQPYFTPDGKWMYYTSMTADSTTDIFAYNLSTSEIKQITKTPKTSEYSPQLTPDKQSIAVVTVEKDGNTQRISHYNLDGKKGKCAYPWLDSVGYFYYFSSEMLVAFVLGNDESTHTLRAVDLKNKTEKIIAYNPGRNFQLMDLSENDKMYDSTKLVLRFVRKFHDFKEFWYYYPATDKLERFMETINNAEDFVMYNNGFLLMASGSSLFRLWAANKNPHWEKLMSFNFPLKNITRIALSPDKTKLALVADGN